MSDTLPDFFKHLFWSQDFKKLDLINEKKTIVINTINYGDLNHWNWIKNFYGSEVIKKTLSEVSASEIRDRVKPLVKLAFSISEFNHAQRSSHK